MNDVLFHRLPDLVVDKVAVQGPTNGAGRFGLSENDGDDIFVLVRIIVGNYRPAKTVTQLFWRLVWVGRVRFIIVPLGVEEAFYGLVGFVLHPPVAPAGEAAGDGSYVLFRVVGVVAWANLWAFVDGKEFEQFTGVVFVGLLLAGVITIQETEHQWVDSHSFHQPLEITRPVLVEQFDDVVLRPVHPLVGHTEVVDPKHGQPFADVTGGVKELL